MASDPPERAFSLGTSEQVAPDVAWTAALRVAERVDTATELVGLLDELGLNYPLLREGRAQVRDAA